MKSEKLLNTSLKIEESRGVNKYLQYTKKS